MSITRAVPLIVTIFLLSAFCPKAYAACIVPPSLPEMSKEAIFDCFKEVSQLRQDMNNLSMSFSRGIPAKSSDIITYGQIDDTKGTGASGFLTQVVGPAPTGVSVVVARSVPGIFQFSFTSPLRSTPVIFVASEGYAGDPGRTAGMVAFAREVTPQSFTVITGWARPGAIDNANSSFHFLVLAGP